MLQLVCDLTIAADNAKFGQTGPNVGSFDGGYGSGYLARTIGHKKAKEVWFMTKQYTAEEALAMNWINTVVPLDQVEDVTMEWAETMLQKPIGFAHDQSLNECRYRWASRNPTTCWRCDLIVLHNG